ncbi:hypothetical protein NQ318_001992 [Aromia moschata]|uniref:FERM adjacent domain-containing protein n=1 Tax=Aromia moschata TaxID=1265417 RepID=A0AAV8Z354_9CUCU|nr:hypothetical protein NQ318_001992 [Aromia moschata]
MGSRFRYSGRTEYQSTYQNRARRTVQLERKPSQRSESTGIVYRSQVSQSSFGKASVGQNSFGKASVNSFGRTSAGNSFGKASIGCSSTYSPVLSVSSKNGTLPRNKPSTPTTPLPATSPTPSNTDSQLDLLFKSLAKESLNGFARDDKRNENKNVEDSTPDCGSKSLPAEIPNNITKVSSVAKPLPPGQIKCNILKAKMEEELQNQKLTNQMFVQAKEEETSHNAATFISGGKCTGPPSLPPIITHSVLKSPQIIDSKDVNEANKDKNEEKDFMKRCPTPVTVTFFGQNDGKLEICQTRNRNEELEKPVTPLSPDLSKVSPWLVSSEIISSPVSKINTTETTIIRKSVITTQL